jgi:outer membrane immunogenic protein
MGVFPMRELKLALLGASFLFAASGAANAADIYSQGSLKDAPPAYMPPITWAGFYIGAHAGWTFGGDVEVDDGDDVDLDESFLAGVHVGYNWQWGSPWVFGLEADYDWLSQEVDDDGDNFDFSDYVASIRARVGWGAGNTLFYGTAGVAFLGLDDDVSDEIEDDPMVGWVAGLGLEHKLRENVSIGLEGLYYNFESDFEDSSGDLETDFWAIRARLTFHLNRGYEGALK